MERSEHYNEAWFTGDTLNMSIGQGFVAVTVLQMANAYAALATNGVVSTPIIAQSIEPHGSTAGSSSIADRSASCRSPPTRWSNSRPRCAPRSLSRTARRFYVFQGSILRAAGKSGTSEDQIVESDAQADIGDQESDAGRRDRRRTEQRAKRAGRIQRIRADEADDDEDEQGPRGSNHVWFTGLGEL